MKEMGKAHWHVRTDKIEQMDHWDRSQLGEFLVVASWDT